MNKSYKQAVIDGNIQRKKNGVISLKGDDWLAVQSSIVAHRFCVTPEAMYNYLVKRKLTVKELFEIEKVSEIIEGILNSN